MRSGRPEPGRGISIGNGILTVDSHDQALARTAEGRNKGEEAARACLSLVSLANKDWWQ